MPRPSGVNGPELTICWIRGRTKRKRKEGGSVVFCAEEEGSGKEVGVGGGSEGEAEDDADCVMVFAEEEAVFARWEEESGD